ncbi:MAG: FprA family A-type flavoprotein, partial [Oscillospiraceae bacterium]
EAFLQDLKAHNFQNRTVAVMENGTWAASSARQIKEIFSSCKALTILEETVSIKSALKQEQMCQIDGLAEKIKEDINL